MLDQRVPVFIRSSGRTQSIGVLIGGEAAPCNLAQRAIATAIESALTHAADIQRGDAGPLMKAERTAQALALATRALQENGQKILGVREQLAKRISTPVIAPWSATSAYFEINTDSLLAQRFASLDPKQRAKTLAAIRADALENRDMLNALLRAPRALSSLSKAEQEGLRVTALRALAPGDFAMMETEIEQLATAERAIMLAGQILADAGLARTVLAEHAPSVIEIAKLQPLRFAEEFPQPPSHAVMDAA